MRTRTGLAALSLAVSAMALTGACTEDHPGPSRPPSWEGKAEQEDAMERAARALNAAGAEGDVRVDEGMEDLDRGLDKTFEAKGDHPYSLDIACQAPTDRTVTLTLARGGSHSEWEVTCGDREADRFSVPAGGRFTATIASAGEAGGAADGLVLWRLSTRPPGDMEGCDDDIKGCES
ncbi:hypothetical protein [Streptomyces sp. NPDC048623]|uniref:hypothetical protein n=1 Tax=Streptomyces sp. NPDC048623 TaxID=3155761 RepID=UPI00342B0996